MFDDNNSLTVMYEILGPADKAYTLSELERLVERRWPILCAKIPAPRRGDIAFRQRLRAVDNQLRLEAVYEPQPQCPLPFDPPTDESIEEAIRQETVDLPQRNADEYAEFIEQLQEPGAGPINNRLLRLITKTGGGEILFTMAQGQQSLLFPDPPRPDRGAVTEFLGEVRTISRRTIQIARLHKITDCGTPIRLRQQSKVTLQLDICTDEVQQQARLAAVHALNCAQPWLRFRAVPFIDRSDGRIAILALSEIVDTATPAVAVPDNAATPD